MNLAGLKQYLDSLGAKFSLGGDDSKLPQELRTELSAMPGGKIDIDVSSGGIVLVDDTLTITGTSADVWPVEGLGTASIGLNQVTIVLGNALLPPVQIGLNGLLPLSGSTNAKVAVALVDQSSTWSAGLVDPATSITPLDLIAIGIKGGLPFAVPPKLDLFSNVVRIDPAGFNLRFTPDKPADAYYRFKASSDTATWKLIPRVIEFVGIDLDMILIPTGWSATVTGHSLIGTIGVDLGVQFSTGPVWNAFLAPTTGNTFPGIVEFANWIAGGAGLGNETSQGFANLGLKPKLFDLALSKVTLSFEPASAKVTNLQIISELTIVGLRLELALDLPALTIAGQLAGGAPVKVVDMLTEARLSTENVPQSLTIAAADFSAAPLLGVYSVSVDVTGIWSVGPVSLEEIKASVDYDNSGGSEAAVLTGSFAATFQFGKFTQLQLSAEYAGADEGWTFAGGTIPGHPIKILDVLDELSTKWGINEVPEAIKSLELTTLTVSFQTGTTKKFNFICAGNFKVAAGEDAAKVALTFTIDVEKGGGQIPGVYGMVSVGDKGYTAKFGGSVVFGDNQFDLILALERKSEVPHVPLPAVDSTLFVGDYVNTATKPTALADLVRPISASAADAIPPGILFTLVDAKFVFLKQLDRSWAFGIRLGKTGIPLRDIPVIGKMLPENEMVGINNLQMLYTSAAFTSEQDALINGLLPPAVTPMPAEGTGQGIALSTDVVVGSFTKHLEFGVKPPQKQIGAKLRRAKEASGKADRTALAAIPASADDPIKWIDIDKQASVFTLRRVGVGYQNNVAEFALDASLSVGPLAFAVSGLSVGSPLTEFKPTFGLTGLSLDFNRPPIHIGGSFMKVTSKVKGEDLTSFYGQLVVQVSQFGLKAVGGWTPPTEKFAGSFFIYLSVNAPIGGPPFLFVTGVAGGFGINTQLRLPSIDEVGKFPLLPASNPPPVGTPAETIAAAIDALKNTILPREGQYWVAAGISFTSFEMIQAQAVLSVSFGVEFQIGVVGTCAMTFPKGMDAKSPIAYVEVDLVASFTPSTGLLAVEAQLSPASNLFGGFVKLSGGFAFYAWFSGDNAGQFVVSLGGYHPAYIKPPIYPVVPRLQISFALGPLKVLGQSYFALTPHAFMAGIRLTATFEAGPIKAWFDAGVDFLFEWAPFHYEAGAHILVGCSVDLGLFTLTIQVGAQLEIWGPEFGGSALVDLAVITFTIEFGAPRAAPPPVGWATFKASFLPSGSKQAPPFLLAAAAGTTRDIGAATNVIKAEVERGKISDGQGNAPGEVNWVIDPDTFSILTQSTVPANNLTWRIGNEPKQVAGLPNDLSDYERIKAVPPLKPIAAALAERLAAPLPLQQPLVGLVPAGMRLVLPADPIRPDTGPTWEPELNIGPMDESSIRSFHQISLAKLDNQGNPSSYFVELTVEPILTRSCTALWAKKPDKTVLNGKNLIDWTLTGVRITPVPRRPAVISAITMLELIYGAGFSTGFSFRDRVVDTRYTLTSKIEKSNQEITIGGAVDLKLCNEDYVLTSMADVWVSAQRDLVLEQLRALNFPTSSPAEINIAATSTTTRLADFPIVQLIGEAA